MTQTAEQKGQASSGSCWLKRNVAKPTLAAALRPAVFALVLFCALIAFISQGRAEARDPRLDQALAAFDAGDAAQAEALLLQAEPGATTDEARWNLAEARATLAHLGEDDAGAVAQLERLEATGADLFGAESPRLIPVLRMLSASLANLGRNVDSSRAVLRAARLGNALGGDDMLATMSDLTRDRVDAGDNAAAALLAAEMVIRDTAEDETLGPYAQEGAALWALALLRAGYADEGLARLLPVLRLAPEDLQVDVPDLINLFDDEAGVSGDAAVSAWTDRAMKIEAARAAADTVLLQALLPLSAALQAGDPVAADSAGRLALSRVALDDPLVTTSYFALLVSTVSGGRNDLAATWGLRLGAMPPYYLAALQNDPLPILETVADWLLDQGRVNEAVELCEAIAALAPLRDGPDAPAVGRALARLGSAYRDVGRQPAARATLQLALTSLGPAPQGPSAALAVRIHTDLAFLARDQGNIAAAEAAYGAAHTLLTTSDAGQDPRAWAFLLAEERSFLITEGRLDEALVVTEQAVAQIIAHSPKGQPDPALLLAAQRDLAESQLEAGKVDEAEATLSDALQGLQSLPQNDALRPRLLALQASVLARLGRGDAAATLQSALLAPGQDDQPDLIAVIEAAKLAKGLGDTATTLTLLTMAINSLPSEHPMLAYLRAGRAAVEVASDPKAALDDLRLATWALTQPDRRAEPQARDHLAFHVTLARQMAASAQGAVAMNFATEAFQVAQRVNDISAGAALAKASARLKGDGPQAAALAQELQDADRRLDVARRALITRLSSGADAGEETQTLEQARLGRAALIADLARSFPDYGAFADPKPLDLAATAALLHPGEVLLLYASADPGASGGEARGTVFAVSHDGYMSADLPPRDELAALARDLRCAAALTDRGCGAGRSGTRGAFSLDAPETEGPVFDLALARQAYLTLMEPVAQILKGKTALIVVPDSSLASLPFQLLLTDDAAPDTPLNQAPWLIRQAAITILPSVANLAALRGKAQSDSRAPLPFLGIGDPLIGAQAGGAQPFDCQDRPAIPALLAMALTPPATILRGAEADGMALASLPALPDTRCELMRAAALFGTPDALLLEADATETRIKTLSQSGELARYRVISFATHGLIAGELGAANAGLVLTPPKVASAEDDGLLTTADIAGLRLDADFVILSVCNSAAGSADQQEGLSGLASAFFLAGARSLLVSHWPVYSDAATRLTSGLVEAMAEDPGIGRAEALRRSMLAVLDDPSAEARSLHPAYWAPFLIAGEGG